MRNATLAIVLAAMAATSAGCIDETAPRDVRPPAAPRGLTSTTGDHSVVLRWLDNTERDVAGYTVYQAPCAGGSQCPYDRVGGTTGTRFEVDGLPNGVTTYFAVAAYDQDGNEGPLSYETVSDTPRPAGFDQTLDDAGLHPETSAWDFSDFRVRAFDDPETDVFFAHRDGVPVMFAPFTDTEIQDAGYASTLDAVDYAPSAGWAPSGTVELIAGHCYVVWTHENRYAKLRVTAVATCRLTFDWAYQVAAGVRELKAHPVTKAPRARRNPPTLDGIRGMTGATPAVAAQGGRS